VIRKLLIVTVILGLLWPASGTLSLAQQTPPPPPPRNLDEITLPRTARLPAAVQSTLQLAQSVAPDLAIGDMAAWSKLAYQSYRNGQWDIFAARGDGSNEIRLTASGSAEIEPRWTRGLTRVAYISREPGNYEIYTMNPDGSGKTRLTTSSANDYNPAWSPDGTKIAFSSYRDGQSEVYVMNANGSGLTRLTNHPAYDGEPVWSPDGAKIAFTSTRGAGGYASTWVMAADGHGPVNVGCGESPAWSPDQLRLACTGDLDGDGWYELRVGNADGSYDWQMISLDGGYAVDILPRSWSPDGRYIAYTRIQYIYYYGNWYWYAAYLEAFDVVNRTTFRLSNQTEEWLPDWQTSDVQKPTSQVSVLPALSASPIAVSWSGVDVGPSGILGYDLQVRDDVTGTWTMWLTRTAGTIAGYPGIGGHTYYFRSRAWDNSYNGEAWPASPDASTTVESLPPISAFNPQPAFYRGGLTMSWNGSDPGGSGIKSYDVQRRDVLTGTWEELITNTTATSAVFTGEAGHTYTFRVRAIDRALNQGAWSSAPSTTTFYAWQLSGQIKDGRGYPVMAARVTLSPTALNSITSTAAGYVGYGVVTGEQSITVTHAGSGTRPPKDLMMTADRKLDQFVRPADDIIVNGDFEMAFAPGDWTAGGVQPPTLTTTIKHTGRQAALLGLPFNWTDPVNIKDPGLDVHSFDMAADPVGNLYAVWKTGGQNVVYAARPKGGVWSTPVVLATGANQEWQGPAIAADALGHVYVAWCDPSYLLYRTRAPDGTWSAPAPIAGSFGYGPSLLVDHENTLHAMWDAGAIFYAAKPLDHDWSAPVAVGGGMDARFDVGADGSVHAVWTIPTSYQWGAAYAARSANGAWSSPIEMSDPSTMNLSIPDVTVDAQGLPHVVWIASGNNVVYTRKTLSGLWTPAVSISSAEQLPPNNAAIAIVAPETIGIAYFDGGVLKLTQSHDSGPWQAPQVLGAAWGGVPQIELDGQGLPQIAWQTQSNIVQSGPAPATLAGDSWLQQVISVPVDLHEPTLSFMYQLSGAAPQGTWLEVRLSSATATSTVTLTINSSGWTQHWVDMEAWAGETVTISFKLHQDTSLPGAWTYIDDVSLGSWLTPDVQAITPGRTKAGAATAITITGDNFIAPIQARLDDISLPDAQWVNTNTITATTPNLPFGRYDVIVTNAGEQVSGLPDALLVSYETFLPVILR
jgi:Tol biopolymer transport system component